MERGSEIYKRKHCTSLSHICNHFQSIYTRTYLLGLCRVQVYLDNFNLFLFDYLLKSILTVIPLIKAQFFYPLSTNLLYQACWAWIHLSPRNSVKTQPLQKLYKPWGYYIFVELCYFEFGLKCMHFFWGVKNLFLNRYYIFVELYYFECGLKTWSVCTIFRM